MVVHDDHVEVEIGSLTKCTPDGIQNGALAVPDRNHDAGSNRELLSRSRHRCETGFQPRADALQMAGRDRFHLQLVLAILGIDVVELLLSRRTRIRRRCGIKRFGNVDDRTVFRNPESQLVQAAPTRFSKFRDCVDANGNNSPEIEIIPNTSKLVIDARMPDRIRIDEPGAGIADHLPHALEHARPGINVDTGIPDEQNIVGSGRSQLEQTRR